MYRSITLASCLFIAVCHDVHAASGFSASDAQATEEVRLTADRALAFDALCARLEADLAAATERGDLAQVEQVHVDALEHVLPEDPNQYCTFILSIYDTLKSQPFDQNRDQADQLSRRITAEALTHIERLPLERVQLIFLLNSSFLVQVFDEDPQAAAKATHEATAQRVQTWLRVWAYVIEELDEDFDMEKRPSKPSLPPGVAGIAGMPFDAVQDPIAREVYRHDMEASLKYHKAYQRQSALRKINKHLLPRIEKAIGEEYVDAQGQFVNKLAWQIQHSGLPKEAIDRLLALRRPQPEK